MKAFTFLCAIALAPLAGPTLAHAADGASVHAVLITASKAKAPADPRLAAYEATLQRNLPESSFHFVSESSATISGPNSHATIRLGNHRIDLDGGARERGGIRLDVQWSNGPTAIMKNTFTFQPGVPIVLGQRPSGDGDVPLVIVVAR